MTRIAFLSLLLIPSVVGAQPSDPTPAASSGNGPNAAVATTVDQELAHYDPHPIRSHSDLVQPAQSGYSAYHRPIASSPRGLFGDVGFYVLRPQWSGGNPAFATTTVTEVIDGFATATTQTDFDHDYSFAPLVQIGYAGRNGLGVRARWWTLRSTQSVGGGVDADADFDVFLQGPPLLGTGAAFGFAGGEGIDVEGSFRNRLSLDVIDLESIWETRVGRSELLLSAGVRYAHIGQTYDADLTQLDTLDDFQRDTSLRANQTFNGAGPTVSAQAYRMIGQTNLSVYGLSRGSLLFGESRQQALSNLSFEVEIPDFDPVVVSETRAAALSSHSVRPVIELEVGTNWTRSLGAFDLFAESGLVGMLWFNAGNAANSDAILGDGFAASNPNQNMGLVGLRFSTGVRF